MTNAMRDQWDLVADCSAFRRWTGRSGLPKIRLAPSTKPACDVQHSPCDGDQASDAHATKQLQSGGTGWDFRLASPTTPTRDVQRSQHEEVRPSGCCCNTATFRCGNIADMKPPARGSLRMTNAMRDQWDLLADCSAFTADSCR